GLGVVRLCRPPPPGGARVVHRRGLPVEQPHLEVGPGWTPAVLDKTTPQLPDLPLDGTRSTKATGGHFSDRPTAVIELAPLRRGYFCLPIRFPRPISGPICRRAWSGWRHASGHIISAASSKVLVTMPG